MATEKSIIIEEQIGGNPQLTEGGATSSYTVFLMGTPSPTADVVITLDVGAQLTTNVTTLTFTSANAGTPQIVTVTATNDTIIEGLHQGVINASSSSSDLSFDGLSIVPIQVAITDNDMPTPNTAPAIAINTTLPFDDSPFDLSGWLFGTSTTAPVAPTVAANQSSLDTTANSTTQAGFLRNDRALDRTLGYSISFTSQILAESHADTDRNADGLDDRAGFSATIIGNDLKGLDIGFFSDRIWVKEGGSGANLLTQAESISFDTTKLATYTLTVLGDTYTLQAKEVGGSNATATLYGTLRDYTASLANVTLSGQTVAPYNTPNFIFFGDNATTTNASFTLKDISVNNGKTTIALPNLAENSANGASVGSVNATDINGDTLIYSITGGNTNSAFAINASTGEITVANSAALNFETTPSFNLAVGVTDGSLTDSAIVTVNLTDINEAPTVVSAIASQAVNNGSAFNYSFGSNVFADPEGTALTYSISGQPSWLNFDSNSRTFSGTANGVGTSTIIVSASDGTNVATSNFAVVVNTPVIAATVFDQSGATSAQTIIGLTSDDNILGSGFNDLVRAGDGADTIFGNGGNDRLYGDGGNDIIVGGTGTDNLFGGLGSDTFIIQSAGNGFDIVNDFQNGLDFIGLSTANSGGLTFSALTFEAFGINGSSTRIRAGGTEIMRLINVAPALITEADFQIIGDGLES